METVKTVLLLPVPLFNVLVRISKPQTNLKREGAKLKWGKRQLPVTLPKDLHQKVKSMADTEVRSFNQQAIFLMRKVKRPRKRKVPLAERVVQLLEEGVNGNGKA